MVKPFKVGKSRPFGRGVLLTIVTFGIYGIYWQFKAQDELFKQYELENEGRDQGVVWLILGLAISPLLFVYHYKFVENVNYLRSRMAMTPAISPLAFILAPIIATAFFFVGYLMFIIALAAANNDIAAVNKGVLFTAVPILAVGALALIIAQLVVYHRLQTGINDTWNYYDSRMAAMQPAANAPAPPPPLF